jgi:1-aminocyclopropane-1-carboxylate deaminase
MNQFWLNTGIPTDIVYTGKLITAFDHLLKENYFKKDTSILLIHSGGLQGNRSLKSGVLLY